MSDTTTPQPATAPPALIDTIMLKADVSALEQQYQQVWGALERYKTELRELAPSLHNLSSRLRDY